LGIHASLDALRQVDFLGGIEQGGTANFVQIIANRVGRNTWLVGVKVGFVDTLRLGTDGFGDLDPGRLGRAGGGDGGLLRRTASPVTTLDVWRCSFGSATR
jgi:hypothetical protein